MPGQKSFIGNKIILWYHMDKDVWMRHSYPTQCQGCEGYILTTSLV